SATPADESGLTWIPIYLPRSETQGEWLSRTFRAGSNVGHALALLEEVQEELPNLRNVRTTLRQGVFSAPRPAPAAVLRHVQQLLRVDKLVGTDRTTIL